MTITHQDTIDFTFMYATHDAFRRDLARLRAAVAAGRCDSPQVRAGWENFKTQLLLHHSVEDSALWPSLKRAVANRPRDLALVEDMEVEHSRLDPLLTSIDKAIMDERANLTKLVQPFSVILEDHLKHEEGAALPLIQDVLTAADWRRFATQMSRRQGVEGAAVYVPWILDEAPVADQRRFLALLPRPVRLVNRTVWNRRYQRRNLWAF
jgi:iron-sulfur cluster repair protein YtfE (RIC family)